VGTTLRGNERTKKNRGKRNGERFGGTSTCEKEREEKNRGPTLRGNSREKKKKKRRAKKKRKLGAKIQQQIEEGYAPRGQRKEGLNKLFPKGADTGSISRNAEGKEKTQEGASASADPGNALRMEVPGKRGSVKTAGGRIIRRARNKLQRRRPQKEARRM